MMPEEKYNNDFRHVVQNVKRKSLTIPDGKSSFGYDVFFPYLPGMNQPNWAYPSGGYSIAPADEIAIIETLAKENAIEIVGRYNNQSRSTNHVEFELKILQPAFEKIVKQYEDNSQAIEFKCKRGHHLATVIGLVGQVKIKCQRCKEINVLEARNGGIKVGVEKDSQENTAT